MQFYFSRRDCATELSSVCKRRLLSGFVRGRSVLRGARVHIRVHASQAAPSTGVQGTRVLVTVIMIMAATRWFPWSRIAPAARSYLPAGLWRRVATKGRIQSISELLTADSSNRPVLVAMSRRVTSTASTITTATLSCSFIILDSVLRGMIAATVMMVVVRWWRVLMGVLPGAISRAWRPLCRGTRRSISPVSGLTWVGWLMVVPNKFRWWNSWLLGVSRTRGSTHYPKGNIVNLNLKGDFFLLNRTVSERVKHIFGAALARLHVLWKASWCVEVLRCRVGAWLASEDEAGVYVAGWGVGVRCLGSHLWRWARSLMIRRDKPSFWRSHWLHKSIVETRMHWRMSSLSRPLVARIERSSVLNAQITCFRLEARWNSSGIWWLMMICWLWILAWTWSGLLRMRWELLIWRDLHAVVSLIVLKFIWAGSSQLWLKFGVRWRSWSRNVFSFITITLWCWHLGRYFLCQFTLLWFKWNITARRVLCSPVLDRCILTEDWLMSQVLIQRWDVSHLMTLNVPLAEHLLL